MCHGLKHPIQHGLNVSWSKVLNLAWLECVMVGNVIFSMAGMCHGKKGQIQHGASEVLEYFSLPAMPT
jgi:hypothetical protein